MSVRCIACEHATEVACEPSLRAFVLGVCATLARVEEAVRGEGEIVVGFCDAHLALTHGALPDIEVRDTRPGTPEDPS